jgi:hypothetical protein
MGSLNLSAFPIPQPFTLGSFPFPYEKIFPRFTSLKHHGGIAVVVQPGQLCL